MTRLISKCLLSIFMLAFSAGAAFSEVVYKDTIAEVWHDDNFLQLLMEVEASLARAQAQFGIIPQYAADEINKNTSMFLFDQEELARERALVGHPQVAVLNVWPRYLEGDAGEYLHFGATSMDIWDTIYIIQMRNSVEIFRKMMLQTEDILLAMCEEYADTPMMGRTLARHALPITFGAKISVWLMENRRHMDRLDDLLDRISTGMISGAVGTYAALGEHAFEVERLTMLGLGLAEPELADWKGARDRHAEYGFVLEGIARTYAKIANELFIMQSDEYREVAEIPRAGAVGSSTMPHKQNPTMGGSISGARMVAGLADVLSEWTLNLHERDQISSSAALAQISNSLNSVINTLNSVLSRIEVRPARMLENMNNSKGLVMAEHLMFLLGERIGKHSAHEVVQVIAADAFAKDITLLEAVQARPDISQYFEAGELERELDMGNYLGLSHEICMRVISHIKALRGQA